MITCFRTVNGKLKKIKLEELTKNCWIDATNPSLGELQDISKILKIPIEEFSMCLDEEERPRVEQTDFYSLIIYRAPYVHKEEAEVEILTSPIGIFLTKDYIVTVHLHHTRYLEDLIERNASIENPSIFSYKIISEITSRYFKILDRLDEEMENIEKDVIESTERKTIEKIFDMKKTLLYFHRSLSANREVLIAIEKGHATFVDRRIRERFRDLYTETIQLIDMAATYREILTGALEIHLSTISNSINNVMKIFTVLTVVLMIPSLIAGIYGMNLTLPIAGYHEAVWVIIFIMFLSVILTLFIFKMKKWL